MTALSIAFVSMRLRHQSRSRGRAKQGHQIALHLSMVLPLSQRSFKRVRAIGAKGQSSTSVLSDAGPEHFVGLAKLIQGDPLMPGRLLAHVDLKKLIMPGLKVLVTTDATKLKSKTAPLKSELDSVLTRGVARWVGRALDQLEVAGRIKADRRPKGQASRQ